MISYIFAILASLTAGIHIFSLKLLSSYDNTYSLIMLIILTMIISRYFIYLSMKYTTNPSIVHLILNLSVFVTFFGSLYLFKMENFNPYIFAGGIVVIITGISMIRYSYNV